MLHAWIEFLPLALVRVLAARYARRVPMPGTCLEFAVARPGVLVRVPPQLPKLEQRP